jgi:exopolysaccharide biosynthesis polyprenyl glycosylphosphotransferase
VASGIVEVLMALDQRAGSDAPSGRGAGGPEDSTFLHLRALQARVAARRSYFSMTAQTATGLPRHSRDADGPPSVALPGPVPLPDPVPLRPDRTAPVISAPSFETTQGFSNQTFAHKRLLEAADMMGMALAVVLSIGLLFSGSHVLLLAIASAPLGLVVFKIGGLHREDVRLVPSTLDETPAILQLTGLFALTISLVRLAALREGLESGEVAAVWLVAFVLVIVGRNLARVLIRRVAPAERCLIMGDVDQAQRISAKLAATGAPALIVGCLPLDQHVDGLWSPGAIRHVVEEMDATRVIIAPTGVKEERVAEVIRMARAAGLNLSVLPRIFEVMGSGVSFDDVDGLTMLGVRRFGPSRSARILKRAFDLIASAMGLLVLAPILAVIAVAIKLDSRGPVFFRQVRVGRDGRHFQITKFRSMVTDAEAGKSDLRLLNEAGDGLFKITNDPRVTRLGRFLRGSSLDELPQLFNVLRGDMSLVGPRPLVVDEDAQVVGLDRSRLHLTPGMTGPWQILNARVPLPEMVSIDYVYVANWSLWGDFKILLRTARHVMRRGNM